MGYTCTSICQIFYTKNTYIDVLSHPPPHLLYRKETVKVYNSGSQGNVFHLGLAQGETWGMMKMV